jgi:hypothetical protein
MTGAETTSGAYFGSPNANLAERNSMDRFCGSVSLAAPYSAPVTNQCQDAICSSLGSSDRISCLMGDLMQTE